jgi:hypothetical protein
MYYTPETLLNHVFEDLRKPKAPNTSFKLLFGDEAITPEEAKTGSIRTLASAEDEEDYKIMKDTIEGTRLQAIEHINKYQAEAVKWQDRKVRLKNIKPRHLVLQRVANLDTVGKLQLKWEGPFLVVSSSRPGSYRLKDMDDNDIPRSWNVDELRDIMSKLCNFLTLPYGTLFLSRGRKVFNGAIGCNFHFFLAQHCAIQGPNSPTSKM